MIGTLRPILFYPSDSLMQKLKVAVAVGCVRSKPEGVTGKEYAQQLCDEFQRSQLEWKQRYERAETEILHLQQQLAMKQTSSVEQMAHDNHGLYIKKTCFMYSLKVSCREILMSTHVSWRNIIPFGWKMSLESMYLFFQKNI